MSEVEDQKRAEALRAYAILDTPEERAFDDLTELTAFVCDVPIALVSLLDRDRQWFKSHCGLDVRETPIEQSFCRHAIKEPAVMVIPDATKDPRFQHNPLVTEFPGIRFYAGAPLVTPSGVPLGSLCAIDLQPRTFDDSRRRALSALARQVVNNLEARRVAGMLNEAIEESVAAKRTADSLRQILPMCAWCRKVRDDDSYWVAVEEYLRDHDVSVSHGMCPACAESFRADNNLA